MSEKKPDKVIQALSRYFMRAWERELLERAKFWEVKKP